MNVLAVGAAGHFAGLVVPELKKRGVTVRGLVRDEKEGATARAHGADETVIGDLGDPASLRAAAEGMDGVFHLNPAFAPDEAAMGVAMVEAAKAAGVRKFVFSSVYHPSISRMVNHAAKRPVEAALYESGMDFTILQPAMFMQNLAGSWPAVVKSGQLSVPYSPLAKLCYVDYRDVAEAAALALTGDTLSYGTFELSAPGMLTTVQLAALMSEALGRPIAAHELSVAEATAQMPAGPLRDGLAAMSADYNQFGFPGGNALVLRAVLEREPRTLPAYLRELVGTMQPEPVHS